MEQSGGIVAFGQYTPAEIFDFREQPVRFPILLDAGACIGRHAFDIGKRQYQRLLAASGSQNDVDQIAVVLMGTTSVACMNPAHIQALLLTAKRVTAIAARCSFGEAADRCCQPRRPFSDVGPALPRRSILKSLSRVSNARKAVMIVFG